MEYDFLILFIVNQKIKDYMMFRFKHHSFTLIYFIIIQFIIKVYVYNPLN